MGRAVPVVTAVAPLVVQGQNDPRVPVTESERLVAALLERGRTVWHMNALQERHGCRKQENRDLDQRAVVLFLGEHLVGPAAGRDGAR